MAFVREEADGKVEVRHDNRDYLFLIEDDSIELVSVITAFRMKDDVSDEYLSVDDVPRAVLETVDSYGAVSVR